jgi:hypothetical protein
MVGALLTAPLPAQTSPSQPIWAKPDLFWYRVPVEGGNLWVRVDAQHGVKEPLFDHQRLAIELTIRTGIEFTPLTLPFADPAAQFVVKYDGSNAYIQEGAMAVEFIHAGQHWRCDLQIKWDWNRVPPTDYECLPRRPALGHDVPKSGPQPVRSPDGRWEAFVEGHNVAIRPAGGGDTRVLSTDGTAAAAWQAGSLLWSSDSATLTAYRVSADVWTSPGISGNVKNQLTRRSWGMVNGQWHMEKR